MIREVFNHEDLVGDLLYVELTKKFSQSRIPPLVAARVFKSRIEQIKGIFLAFVVQIGSTGFHKVIVVMIDMLNPGLPFSRTMFACGLPRYGSGSNSKWI